MCILTLNVSFISISQHFTAIPYGNPGKYYNGLMV